jgi:hypothetical protein
MQHKANVFFKLELIYFTIRNFHCTKRLERTFLEFGPKLETYFGTFRDRFSLIQIDVIF